MTTQEFYQEALLRLRRSIQEAAPEPGDVVCATYIVARVTARQRAALAAVASGTDADHLRVLLASQGHPAGEFYLAILGLLQQYGKERQHAAQHL